MSFLSTIMSLGLVLEETATSKIDAMKPRGSGARGRLSGTLRSESRGGSRMVSRGRGQAFQAAKLMGDGVSFAGRSMVGAKNLGSKFKNTQIKERQPKKGADFRKNVLDSEGLRNLPSSTRVGFEDGIANDDTLVNAMDYVKYNSDANTYGGRRNLADLDDVDFNKGDGPKSDNNHIGERPVDPKKMMTMDGSVKEALDDVKSAENDEELGNAVTRASALDFAEDGSVLPSELEQVVMKEDNYEYGILRSKTLTEDGMPSYFTQYKKDRKTNEVVSYMTSGVSDNGLRSTTLSNRKQGPQGLEQENHRLLTNSTSDFSDVLGSGSDTEQGFSKKQHIEGFKDDYIKNAQQKTKLHDFSQGYPGENTDRATGTRRAEPLDFRTDTESSYKSNEGKTSRVRRAGQNTLVQRTNSSRNRVDGVNVPTNKQVTQRPEPVRPRIDGGSVSKKQVVQRPIGLPDGSARQHIEGGNSTGEKRVVRRQTGRPRPLEFNDNGKNRRF